MVITLDSQLEAALIESARKRGVSPNDLAVNALRERFMAATPENLTHEEWRQRLRSAATNCGVSLSHEDLGSEWLYD